MFNGPYNPIERKLDQYIDTIQDAFKLKLIPNEQEKTYVISWNEALHGKICGSFTQVIVANTIQEAIDKIVMNGTACDKCITYIYHD